LCIISSAVGWRGGTGAELLKLRNGLLTPENRNAGTEKGQFAEQSACQAILINELSKEIEGTAGFEPGMEVFWTSYLPALPATNT